MASLNEVKLIGRVGKEPEVANTNDGKPILKFSLATTDRWTDKLTNEKKEKTEWHRIVIYNNARLCDAVKEQRTELSGALVYICGKLRYEKWVNQSGVEQKSTSIVIDSYSGQLTILSRKNKTTGENRITEDQKKDEESDNGFGDFDLADDSEEIPF